MSIKIICRSAFFIIGFLFLNTPSSQAQFATRKISKKQQSYIDSLKQVEYNYIFPILGQQAYKQGFDIPYPAGLMLNYIWMDQGIIIDNFQMGIPKTKASPYNLLTLLALETTETRPMPTTSDQTSGFSLSLMCMGYLAPEGH